MDLKTKYSQLINAATSAGVGNLKISESNDVLHISGTTDSQTKDRLWDMYDKIDPDMRSGDLVLDLETSSSVSSGNVEYYTIQEGDNLSKIAKKYPGMTWQKLYEANKDTIKDPNIIYPGKQIRIP